MVRRVFILAGGELGDPAFFEEQRRQATPIAFICADGGARHLAALGIQPDLIIGDLDSLGKDHQEAYAARGVRIFRHPSAKDKTDTELALQEAFRLGPEEVWIWGGLGLRLDHTLANCGLLLQGAGQGVEVRLIDPWCEVMLVKGRRALAGEAGQTVSLFPFGGEARGVTLTGFAYPLTRAVMTLDHPYGISNRLVAAEGIIEVASGSLLMVRYFRAGVFPGEERR
ncbi:MAG: thiamine diphosphokinase [Syntrophaceae bacterium]|nr:thiamine diphosphokinase [Syntrophaceae bacterium]